jgi:dihydropteroate synthase
MRPVFQWNLGSRHLELGKRTLVMGILNVTPDSFSDGGQFSSSEEAAQRALQMADEGAEIIDIGGESTRPGVHVGGNASVPASEELRRVLPVVKELKRLRPELILSIDTYKSEVARASVDAGVEIVNDVSSLTWDLEMAKNVAALPCGVVLMHTRGKPEEWRSLPPEPRIVEIVEEELHAASQNAIAAGIHHDRIVLDPGFGFGKNFENNYPLLAKFEELHSMGFALLAGISRKGFLGRTAGARIKTELPAPQRVYPSVAAAVIAALKGAHIVRVHDVRPTVEAVAIVDAVLEDEDGVNPWFDAYS